MITDSIDCFPGLSRQTGCWECNLLQLKPYLLSHLLPTTITLVKNFIKTLYNQITKVGMSFDIPREKNSNVVTTINRPITSAGLIIFHNMMSTVDMKWLRSESDLEDKAKLFTIICSLHELRIRVSAISPF